VLSQIARYTYFILSRAKMPLDFHPSAARVAILLGLPIS
jgi:hypothetical protein